MVVQKELQLKLKHLISETVTMLCKNTLPFKAELTLEGLLGITLDNQDIVLVNLNETFADKSKKKAADDALVIPDSPPSSPKSNSSTPQRGTASRTPDSGRRNRDGRVPPSPSQQQHVRQRGQQAQANIMGGRRNRTNESIDLTDEMDLDVIVVEQREPRNRNVAQHGQQQQPYPTALYKQPSRKTILTPAQRTCLEKAYYINSRPTNQDMAKIADELKLERDVVKTWFLHKRASMSRGYPQQQQKLGAQKGVFPGQFSNLYRPIRNAQALPGYPRMTNPNMPNIPGYRLPNQHQFMQQQAMGVQQFTGQTITPQQYNNQNIQPIMNTTQFTPQQQQQQQQQPQPQQQQPPPVNNQQVTVEPIADPPHMAEVPGTEPGQQYTAPANPVNVVKPVDTPMDTDYTELTNTATENAEPAPVTTPTTENTTGTLSTPPPVVASPTPAGTGGTFSTPSTPGSDKTIITGQPDALDTLASAVDALPTAEEAANSTSAGFGSHSGTASPASGMASSESQQPDESHSYMTRQRAATSNVSGSNGSQTSPPTTSAPDPTGINAQQSADSQGSTEDTLPVIGEILSLNKLAKITEDMVAATTDTLSTSSAGPKQEPHENSEHSQPQPNKEQQERLQTFHVVQRKTDAGQSTFEVVPSVKKDDAQ